MAFPSTEIFHKHLRMPDLHGMSDRKDNTRMNCGCGVFHILSKACL